MLLSQLNSISNMIDAVKPISEAHDVPRPAIPTEATPSDSNFAEQVGSIANV